MAEYVNLTYKPLFTVPRLRKDTLKLKKHLALVSLVKLEARVATLENWVKHIKMEYEEQNQEDVEIEQYGQIWEYVGREKDNIINMLLANVGYFYSYLYSKWTK